MSGIGAENFFDIYLGLGSKSQGRPVMKRLFLVSMESQRSKYLFGTQFWAPRGNLVHLYGLKSIRAIMAPPVQQRMFQTPSRIGLKFFSFATVCLSVCLFMWTPSLEGKRVSLLGFCLTSGAGVVGNAPYQVLPTYVEPGIQTFLTPRPVQS